MNRQPQKYVYVQDGHNIPPRPALGYMLIALAEAYFHAWLTNRALIIDWRNTVYTSNPDKNLFSELFEINEDALGVPIVTQDIDEVMKDRSVFEMDKSYYDTFIANHDVHESKEFIGEWKKNARKKNAALLWNSIVTGECFSNQNSIFPEIQKNSGEYSLTPLLYVEEDVISAAYIGALMPFHDRYHPALDKFISCLRLKPPFRDKLYEFKGNNFFGKQVIGLHIRHGNGEQGDFSQKKRQIKELDKKIDLIIKHVEDLSADIEQELSVFLCTDSDVIVEKLTERLPEVITREQWRPEVGAGISFELGHDCPDGEIENAANAAIDIFLLGSCNYMASLEPISWFFRAASRRMITAQRTLIIKEHLGNATFACAELPAGIANSVEGTSRISSGEAGCLVHGPYIQLNGKGRRYCAELTYLTKGAAMDGVGTFDVTISRRDDHGGSSDFVTLDKTVLQATGGKQKTVRLEFDSSERSGWFVETRVHVNQGIELQVFQIHTRSLDADLNNLAA